MSAPVPLCRDAAVMAAFEATWPAAEYAEAGGFRVGRGMGGGGRVGSARAVADWSEGDIDATAAVQTRWGEPASIAVADGDTALADALVARGWDIAGPTAILAAPVAALTDRPIPPVTTFAIWPPLAIQAELWDAMSIGPARRAVMARAAGPKVSLLGRMRDRAAGTGFVAVSGDVAMVHALAILPEFRRAGLAGWMMRRAAVWGAEHGASRLALAVTRGNDAAMGLYRNLGFADLGGYRYATRAG